MRHLKAFFAVALLLVSTNSLFAKNEVKSAEDIILEETIRDIDLFINETYYPEEEISLSDIIDIKTPKMKMEREERDSDRHFPKKDGAKGKVSKGEHHGKGGSMKGLNLTEEQKSSIKALTSDSRRESLSLQNRLGELMAHQKTLTTGENQDLKSINSNIDEIFVIKADLAKQRAATQLEIRDLLDKDQQLTFDLMKGKEKGKGKGKSRHQTAHR